MKRLLDEKQPVANSRKGRFPANFVPERRELGHAFETFVAVQADQKVGWRGTGKHCCDSPQARKIVGLADLQLEMAQSVRRDATLQRLRQAVVKPLRRRDVTFGQGIRQSDRVAGK